MAKPAKISPSLSPLITQSAAKPLSKLQQQFNKKVKQIENLKKDIATKEELLITIRKRIEKELSPISKQVIENRVDFVKLLDEAYALSFFRKREKQKLAEYITDLAFDLIDRFGRSDLLPLHDKYADLSFEETIAQEEEEEKAFTEQIFGKIFGIEIDLDNPESIEEQLEREMEQREQEKQTRQKGRKTKAQLAKEEKAKAELSNISKASRRVYTDLAKQLHPDVEQDPTVRTWKEEAMKRVTQAYQHDDFFELLHLQAEFMQEKSANLKELPEDQLKYYIKILQDQIRELQEQKAMFTYGPDSSLLYKFGSTPKQMEQSFKRAKEALQYELEGLKAELRALEDPQEIRELLKQIK